MTHVDERLSVVLAQHNADKCKCGRTLDRGDIAWNTGSTDAGTPTSHIEIQCQSCDREIVRVWSWSPWLDSFEDVVEILENEIEPMWSYGVGIDNC